MKQFIVDRHTTPNTPTLEQVPTEKIPLYPTEQDLLDDLANLEVGQIVGVIDPAESELIGTLIQRIQELENGEKYSTEEVKTNKKWWNGSAWVDVYRKSFSGTGFTSSAISLGISNIDEIISLDSMARVDMLDFNGFVPLAGAVRTTNSSNCNPAYLYISTDKTTYRIFKAGTQSQADLYEWHFTIEYTKTSA